MKDCSGCSWDQKRKECKTVDNVNFTKKGGMLCCGHCEFVQKRREVPLRTLCFKVSSVGVHSDSWALSLKKEEVQIYWKTVSIQIVCRMLFRSIEGLVNIMYYFCGYCKIPGRE